MSTILRIGILKKDGSIKSIYCHFDGYPEWVGQKLYKYYNDLEKINNLINLGDISHLEDNLEPVPTMKHEFGHDTEQPNVVVAYHRDRKEDWEYVQPKHFKNIKEFAKYCKESDQEYTYLYDEKNQEFIWSEIPYDMDEEMIFNSLKDKLLELGIINLVEERLDKLIWKIIDYEKNNDINEFQTNFNNDTDAFNYFKEYFNSNGFEDYKKSLKDNLVYLEEDKCDLLLGKVYETVNDLLKGINEFDKDKDIEL